MKKTTLRNCIDVISDWYGVHVSENKMVLICKDLSLTERVNGDTQDREDIIGFIAQEVTGMRWPRFGDSEDYKRDFAEKFKTNALGFGYALDDDWEI